MTPYGAPWSPINVGLHLPAHAVCIHDAAATLKVGRKNTNLERMWVTLNIFAPILGDNGNGAGS